MFGVYVPGRHDNDPSLLKEVGAGWALDPSATPMFSDLSEGGPDGGGGKLVALSGPLCGPELASIEPDQQQWQCAGGYWLGIWNRCTTTADIRLRRAQMIGGADVILGDGSPWQVPGLLDSLKSSEVSPEKMLARLPFLRRTDELRDFLRGDEFQNRVAEDGMASIPGGRDYAVEAISLNYRISAELADMLNLIDDMAALRIIAVATGLELLAVCDQSASILAAT